MSDESMKQPLADRVYDALAVQFMTGERPPGQRLKIQELSHELQVSQTPIREALARLEHTGFIDRQSQRGYVVARLLGSEEIAQFMDARLLLEPAMVRGAAQRSTEEFMAQLADTISVMKNAGTRADGETLRQCWLADETFHTLIADQSGNRFMAKAFHSLGGQLQRFRIIGRSGISHARSACAEHEAVYAALLEQDGHETAAQMHRHISNAKERALADLSRTERDDELSYTDAAVRH